MRHYRMADIEFGYVAYRRHGLDIMIMQTVPGVDLQTVADPLRDLDEVQQHR